MSTLRLDKYLADMQAGTRSEVKNHIRKGRVQVNGLVVNIPEMKIDTENDKVLLDGKSVSYTEFEYYMLNKPQGVLSAARDKKQKTVIDLIEDKKRKDLYPLGRLDKDTEGLLIITNDGDMTHKILSPKNHIKKVYYAITDGIIPESAVNMVAAGLILNDGTPTMPGKLEILRYENNTTHVRLTIYEGKFHQVKRMMETLGGTVIFLKRFTVGDIELDPELKPGEYRSLTEKEIKSLKGATDNL